MTEIETYRTMEDGFLLVLVKFVEKEQYLIFLLDPWKAGYRDFDRHKGDMRSLKRKVGIPNLKFHLIKKKEAAVLLRQNVEIAKELGFEIDEEAQKWMEKLGVFNVEFNRTLYSCFNCETGDLTQDQIDEILEIAKKEIDDDIIGTEEEEQYFKICTKCEEDLHEKHDGQSHHHH